MHEGIKTVEEFLKAAPTAFPFVNFISEDQINVGLDSDCLPLFTIEAYDEDSLRISTVREVWFCDNDNIKSFLRGAAMALRLSQPLNDW